MKSNFFFISIMPFSGSAHWSNYLFNPCNMKKYILLLAKPKTVVYRLWIHNIIIANYKIGKHGCLGAVMEQATNKVCVHLFMQLTSCFIPWTRTYQLMTGLWKPSVVIALLTRSWISILTLCITFEFKQEMWKEWGPSLIPSSSGLWKVWIIFCYCLSFPVGLLWISFYRLCWQHDHIQALKKTKMQIKTAMSYHLLLFYWPSSKTQEITNAGHDLEKKEIMYRYIVAGVVNWSSHCGKHYEGFSENWK